MPKVIGPEHCEDHRAHRVGCLDCAAAVMAAHDDDLDAALGRMESIGWAPTCRVHLLTEPCEPCRG